MNRVFALLTIGLLVTACGGSAGVGKQSFAPTETNTPEPSSDEVSPDIKDGTWLVGSEVEPGTYIAFVGVQEGSYVNCYWETSSDGEHGGIAGNSGVGDINNNGNESFQAIVTITAKDYAFYSNGCGGWWNVEQYKALFGMDGGHKAYADDLGYAPGDGVFIVGYDIMPGTYRSSSEDGCYWARLKNFTGGLESIIDNFFGDGSTLVKIKPSDVGFRTSGCGTWTPLGN